MSDPASFVENSQLLTDIFGCWPSFHDAEVFEVNLTRGEVDIDANLYVFPSMTVKLHLWELTNETNPQGTLITRKHTIATLRFHDLMEEGFEIWGFNHQNAIFELAIDRVEPAEGPSPILEVVFRQSFGMGAEFKCMRAEVLNAIACDEKGKAIVA